MLALSALSRACTLVLSVHFLYSLLTPINALIPLLDDPSYPECGLQCEECLRVLSINLDWTMVGLSLLPTDPSLCECPSYNYTVTDDGMMLYQHGRSVPIGKLTSDPDADKLILSISYWNNRQLTRSRCTRPYVPNTDQCLGATSLRGKLWFISDAVFVMYNMSCNSCTERDTVPIQRYTKHYLLVNIYIISLFSCIQLICKYKRKSL